VLANVSVGNFSTYRKSALRRWSSRSSVPVRMLAASISTSTCEFSGGSATVIAPETFSNRPRTLVRMCRAMNSAVV
jgi:hypothetical protein